MREFTDDDVSLGVVSVIGSNLWLGTTWIADPAETMALSDDFERAKVGIWARGSHRCRMITCVGAAG